MSIVEFLKLAQLISTYVDEHLFVYFNIGFHIIKEIFAIYNLLINIHKWIDMVVVAIFKTIFDNFGTANIFLYPNSLTNSGTISFS